jgi:hypothetical protein
MYKFKPESLCLYLFKIRANESIVLSVLNRQKLKYRLTEYITFSNIFSGFSKYVDRDTMVLLAPIHLRWSLNDLRSCHFKYNVVDCQNVEYLLTQSLFLCSRYDPLIYSSLFFQKIWLTMHDSSVLQMGSAKWLWFSVLLFPKPRSVFCYSSVGLELPDLWTRTKYVTKSSRTIPCSSVKIRYIPIVFCLSESDSKVRRSNHMCLPFNNLKYQHHLVISRSLPCPLNEWSGVSNDGIDEL